MDFFFLPFPFFSADSSNEKDRCPCFSKTLHLQQSFTTIRQFIASPPSRSVSFKKTPSLRKIQTFAIFHQFFVSKFQAAEKTFIRKFIERYQCFIQKIWCKNLFVKSSRKCEKFWVFEIPSFPFSRFQKMYPQKIKSQNFIVKSLHCIWKYRIIHGKHQFTKFYSAV